MFKYFIVKFLIVLNIVESVICRIVTASTLRGPTLCLVCALIWPLLVLVILFLVVVWLVTKVNQRVNSNLINLIDIVVFNTGKMSRISEDIANKQTDRT